MDRQRDALGRRRGLPVDERLRIEAELRGEVNVELGRLRELGLAVERLLDALVAAGATVALGAAFRRIARP